MYDFSFSYTSKYNTSMLLLSHINSGQTSINRVCGHTIIRVCGHPIIIRCWRPREDAKKPNEIEIRPGNTTLSRLKTHDTKEKAYK